MLIYANHFEISGENREDDVFRTIKGWLKKITKLDLSIKDLKSGDDFQKNNFFIRTIKDDEAQIFSISLTHNDKEIKGREWKTEIGIKNNEESLFLSLIVETIEQSTLVSEVPQSTRPELIKFLQNNCTFHLDTVGLSNKIIGNNKNDFYELKNKILDKHRDYPIILVSCTRDGEESFVECDKLQEHLFGLAQVYFLDSEINSYELENYMESKKYCAWDGAINIIYPINKFNQISNTLFSRTRLDELDNVKSGIFRAILSYVTHYTNIRKKSKHLSAYDVKLQSLKSRRNKLKNQILNLNFDNNDELAKYKQLAEEWFEELSKAEENFSEQLRQQANSFLEMLSQSEQKVNELEQENLKLKSKIYSQPVNTNQTENSNNSISIYLNERDLYSNEIKMLILEAIQNYFKNLPQDDTNTRRYHILNNLLTYNSELLKQKEDYIHKLKVAFKGYKKLDKKQQSLLSEFNIELKNEVYHNTIGFVGEERYKSTFAKTASDTNAGDNIVRDIKKQLL